MSTRQNKISPCLIIFVLISLLFSPDSIFASAFFKADPLDSIPNHRRNRLYAGTGLLVGGYVVGPLLASQAWWANGFIWDNPLHHIGEGEPYLADNAWHVLFCIAVSQTHYYAFNDLLCFLYPKTAAAGMTLLTYTGIECLDAIEASGRWEFSVSDEVSNFIGVGFWLLKQNYPDLPIYIRGGVRKWGEAFTMAREVPQMLTDYKNYFSKHSDHYAISKVDCIYKFDRQWYAGIALSKKDKPSMEDLWGITVGYDCLMLLTKHKGWWNPAVATACSYLAFPVSFTIWIE